MFFFNFQGNFTGKVEKFVTFWCDFFLDIEYQNYENWFVFDWVVQQIYGLLLFGPQCSISQTRLYLTHAARSLQYEICYGLDVINDT